jgi:oxygen-independent coproporphyrinogen III oxidase
MPNKNRSQELTQTELFQKYDIPAPRYTSYPTVPYWDTNPTTEEWLAELTQTYAKPEMSWSMYMHIPFCETLCTFCGCNTSITRDHGKEHPYVEVLQAEFSKYLEKIPNIAQRPLTHLHLGGGTPTFLSAENLTRLLEPILSRVQRDMNHFEGSIEVDPRRTNVEQLKAMRALGFNRVSLGVQDFDPEVQRLVNRVQPRDITERITNESRALGFTSVNYDLIYGLPKQNEKTIEHMAVETVKLKPDRIALYSFAMVPWIKPAQRLFKDEDVPSGAPKRKLYEIARGILLSGGYIEIGMDHFALATDQMAKSAVNGRLHRNFMGYTDHRTDVLLGIGVSAISEAPNCFHQNEKVHPVYERTVRSGEIPTFRGHKLTQEDRLRREQILKLMTVWQVALESAEQFDDISKFLKPLVDDGLVTLKDQVLYLTEAGRPFLRNACMALDSRLRSKQPGAKVFSQAI